MFRRNIFFAAHHGQTIGPSQEEELMLKEPTLGPITKNTISDIIVEKLISYISLTGLKPGDRLPAERDLIVRLGVSRSSLREAIKVLKILGIITVSAGEGMFVGEGDISELAKPLSWSLMMSHSSLHEVMEARRILEVDIAGLAAQRATVDQVMRIEDELVALQKSAAHPSKYNTDLKFHLAVARAANNRMLLYTNITYHNLLRTLLTAMGRPLIQKSHIHHELEKELPAIYEAIRKKDSHAARQAMSTHLLSADKTFGIVSN
jgi:GntR family transcriptional repressor for pyruvate dehydrogenase complex